MRKNAVRFAMLAGAALVAVPAAAQQAGAEASAANDAVVGDIVVTAQKRSESLQNVPLAITALSGDSLVDRNINDMTGLAASVPNMTFGSYGGAARISIRGIGYDNIGQGQEGRIAYHLDGIYISRPADVLGTFYDVERVEVLRGPQGTLYGRNATGGSINVITRAPTDDWRGYVRVGYGNYNALTSEGAVGGPIAPGARFRIAYTVEDRDGYGRNLTTGNDVDNARRGGVRGALSIDLGASGKLDLSADYYREKDANYGYKYLGAANPAIPAAGFRVGGFVPAHIRDIATDFDPVNDRESYGFSARAEFDLGGVILKSISAYRHSDFSLKAGADGTSATLAEINYFTRAARQFSQELQLSGDLGPLRYILGAYYFDEKVTGGSVIPLNLQLIGGPDRLVQGLAQLGTIHKKAAAAFGQLDYDVSDQLTLTLGGRYSWERYRVNDFTSFNLAVPYPPFVNLMAPALHAGGNSATDTSFTPKVQLSYKPRPSMMLYASASKGFKSGGFDIGTTAPAFEPETLWAYEGGMKGTFADGRVRINVAGFYYDYTNIQVTKVLFSVVRIENAAASVIYGGEAELTLVPFDGLQVDVTPAWLHSEYRNYITENPSRPGEPVANQDRSGNQLIQAPEMSLQVGAEYGWDMAGGRVKLRGEMKFQDRI